MSLISNTSVILRLQLKVESTNGTNNSIALKSTASYIRWNNRDKGYNSEAIPPKQTNRLSIRFASNEDPKLLTLPPRKIMEIEITFLANCCIDTNKNLKCETCISLPVHKIRTVTQSQNRVASEEKRDDYGICRNRPVRSSPFSFFGFQRKKIFFLRNPVPVECVPALWAWQDKR
ncbi:hypothetical protein DSO57_1024005 [Entomophthora muscae]|uniref:Uncharacterized protein n=1 Tax=Entomophthora muscae TaxID=34485 RepID=A0ACC2T2U7_9FUNG|nr:hypothetical protein DSO57_1024005 [Entomophthora muscae]